MKKGIIILLLLFIGLVGLFLAQKVAFATTIVSQPIYDTLSETGKNQVYQTIGNSYLPEGTTITSFTFKLKLLNTDDIRGVLYKDVITDPNSFRGNCGAYTIVENQIIPNETLEAGVLKNYTFTLSTPHTVPAGNLNGYFIRVYLGGSYTNNFQIAGTTNANAINPGQTAFYNGGNCIADGNNVEDAYFLVDYNPAPTLAINSPANSTTTIPNFINAELVYNLEDWENYSVLTNYMCYGRNQTLVGNCTATSNNVGEDLIVESPKFLPSTSTLEFINPKQTDFDEILDEGVWYAKSLLYAYQEYGEDILLAQSPEISFTIGIPFSNPSISWLYPTNESNVSDFYFWNLEYNFDLTIDIEESFMVSIYYAASSTFAECNDTEFYWEINGCHWDYGASSQNTTTTFGSILKKEKLPVGDYTAKAFLSIILDEPLASSTINFSIIESATTTINFLLDNSITPLNPFFVYPTSTYAIVISGSLKMATSTCEDFDFFTNWSPLGCHISNIWITFFNKTIDSINNFIIIIGNVVKKTFPLNIFVHINNDIQRAKISTSTPDIVLSSYNPKIFGGHSYTLLTSQTQANISAKVGFNFRELETKIMYAGTGILIILQTIMIIGHLRKEKQDNV